MKVQHVSSLPVSGRKDIPIAGPIASHGENQALTYAEQMLRMQKDQVIHGNVAPTAVTAEKLQPFISEKSVSFLLIAVASS